MLEVAPCGSTHLFTGQDLLTAAVAGRANAGM
jgi:hypothetical protein